MIFYLLDENNNVVAGSQSEAEKLLTSDRKIIKQQGIGDYWVSTVFLVIDHNYCHSDEKRPVLFETMVFPTDIALFQRYCTYEEALNGHNEIVEKLKKVLSLREDKKQME